MNQLSLDQFLNMECQYRKVSTHNHYAYCYSPDHLTKWGYACYCPPIGSGDPPICPEVEKL